MNTCIYVYMYIVYITSYVTCITSLHPYVTVYVFIYCYLFFKQSPLLLLEVYFVHIWSIGHPFKGIVNTIFEIIVGKRGYIYIYIYMFVDLSIDHTNKALCVITNDN